MEGLLSTWPTPSSFTLWIIISWNYLQYQLLNHIRTTNRLYLDGWIYGPHYCTAEVLKCSFFSQGEAIIGWFPSNTVLDNPHSVPLPTPLYTLGLAGQLSWTYSGCQANSHVHIGCWLRQEREPALSAADSHEYSLAFSSGDVQTPTLRLTRLSMWTSWKK